MTAGVRERLDMDELQRFAFEHPMTRATALEARNFRRVLSPQGVAVALSVNR